MLMSTYRPGTLTMLECRFNKTTHHVVIISPLACSHPLDPKSTQSPAGGDWEQTETGSGSPDAEDEEEEEVWCVVLLKRHSSMFITKR